jgi:hypothetical protein
MIPPFTSDGVLPPTDDSLPYPCTRAEMEERLVLAFPDSGWRRFLFDNWDLLRTSVAEICPRTRWWVWGTLVTSRKSAFRDDLAVVNTIAIVPFSDLPHNVGQRQLLQSSIAYAELRHHVDAALVFDFPVGDPRRLGADEALTKWRRHGSRNIVDDDTREQIPAGYIEVLP